MKTIGLVVIVMTVVLFSASPALAQSGDRGAAPLYGNAIGAGIGAAITILGAGWGFGRIGAGALESMARQPETAGQIQTAMLIIAALLEGATFFSLIICILMALRA